MYEARQNKEKVSRRIEADGGTRQRRKNMNYKSEILQRREINGSIDTDQEGKIFPRGETNPKGTLISNLMYGPQSKWRLMHTDCDNLTNIRGHLIKAFWDGGNDENRIVQWNREYEDIWSLVENNAEKYVENLRNNKQKSFNVKTITDDPNVGYRLLGRDYNEAKRRFQKNMSPAQYNQAIQVLNRQITKATMYIEGHPVGNISCSRICNELKLKQ